jgi:CTP synthase
VLSPYEHGEVFVLDDGGECDLDLGNYERFSDVTLTRDHNITTGKIYQQVTRNSHSIKIFVHTRQYRPMMTKQAFVWASHT